MGTKLIKVRPNQNFPKVKADKNHIR